MPMFYILLTSYLIINLKSKEGPLFLWQNGHFLTWKCFVKTVREALTAAGLEAENYAFCIGLQMWQKWWLYKQKYETLEQTIEDTKNKSKDLTNELETIKKSNKKLSKTLNNNSKSWTLKPWLELSTQYPG